MSFWVSGATLLVGAGTAVAQHDAAGNALAAQNSASNSALGQQRQDQETMLSLTANQRAVGNQALNALGSTYGYAPAAGYANDEYGQTTLDQEHGRLIGDTMLPANAELRNYDGKWGEVWVGDVRVGTLRPGGASGKFIGNGTPIPKAPAGASRGAQGTPQQGNQLAADYSQFYKSPDYNFRMTEGLNVVKNNAALGGGLYGGNALRGIEDYGQNLAAGGFQDWVNNQLALAGMGTGATSIAVQGTQQTGNNISNLLTNQGNNRASGIINQSNAITGGVNDLASIYGQWRGGYFNRGTGVGGNGLAQPAPINSYGNVDG